MSVQAGATPLSEQGKVEGAWFAGNGDRIIASERGGRIGFWDAVSGEALAAEIDRFVGGENSWSKVDQEGKWVLAGSKEGGSRLYDFQTGKAMSAEIPASFQNGRIRAALSPGGFRLMTFEQREVARIHDTKTGQKVAEIPLDVSKDDPDAMPEGVFEQNGKRAWILDSSGAIRCFDTTTWKPVGETLRHPGSGYYSRLSIGADGRYIMACSDQPDCGGIGMVCVWDAATRRLVGKPVEKAWGAGAEFVDGGKRMRVFFGRGASYVASLPSWSADYYLPMHSDLDGPHVLGADAGRLFVSWGADGIVSFTEASTGSPRGSYHGSEPVLQIAASPVKDRVVALLGRERLAEEKAGSATLMRLDRKEDAAPGQPLVCTGYTSLRYQEVLTGDSLAISPDGVRVLLVVDGRVRLFQVADLKELPSTTVAGVAR
ncbi:WD40 repeat domain-containing protein [Luteolibacter sp. LG18]|uniref:WD40 repeat domain-containing protein n=1 Tax=Luteolibacter sp. LG18 TaxID=2819286 RepID=UPI0030C6C584